MCLRKAAKVARYTAEVTPEVARMLRVLEQEMNRTEIMNALGLNDEKHFREHYQQTAVAAGLIEMTIPDKPRSSKQRYRLTAPGKAARNASSPSRTRSVTEEVATWHQPFRG